MRKRFFKTAFAICLAALAAQAELVHVYQRTIAGSTTNQLSDTVLETTVTYTTQAAPEISGFIFTHWSISTAQEFTNRDRWGRAFDSAPYTLYEETTLTANYLPATQDSDADGMADGYELYWYGDLAKSAQADTDDDGFTFEEEIALGTNPLFADEYAQGGIEYADSELILYNPLCYQPYILRSDPEGALFESSTNWVRPGTSASSPSYDHTSTVFAYWSINGAQQRDRWGRALDSVSFTMPSNAVELVAHTSTDDLTREALYWYGSSTISAQSDSDGDGFTFEEEIALGTNPLFADEYAQGGIEYADSELLLYNPYDIQPYIVRSAPEGVLFATATNWVRGGTAVSSPVCDHTSTAFAYWTLNGTQQRDRWGRALDSVTFVMPSEAVELVAVTVEDEQDRQSLYWYGCPAESAPADSDGDGFTFEEELALGTNPLFTDEYAQGGIEYADSELLEANLQPYEQLTRGLVDGEAEELFRSNWEQNDGAMNFGTNAAVAVVDANGDGLEDLLIAGTGPDGGMRTTLLLNHGATGSPDFTIAENPWAALNAALAAGGTIAGGLGPNGANGVYLSGEPIRFFDFDTGTFSDTALSGVPAWHDGVLYALDPVAGTVSTTNGVLALDTRIIRGVSLAVADADNDGLSDLLITDEDGRVWFYKGIGEQGNSQLSTLNFQLRHKVWGGSFGGFAEGLKIAATDWNADGNLDAIGATAGGTLVLLRDPRVGVPANLRIAAGMTSVLLEWDPNTQSRVRGYRVYRGDSQAGDFAQITEPWTPLPSYRDYPGVLQDWWYRVTSVGRFYTSGNSAPTFVESSPTEALVAHLGGIELFVRDANGATGQDVEIVVAINNSLGVAAKDLSLTLEYDTALLEPRRVLPSGLTEAVAFTENAANGAWTVSATSGTVDPGAGTLFTFVFYVKPQHVADETTLSITAAAAKSVSGQSATIPLPVSGTLSIFDTDPPVRPNVSVETCVREVIERETVELPVVLVTDRTLDASTLLVSGSYDGTFLAPGASGNIEAANGRWTVSGLAGTIPVGTNTVATLVFTALDVASDMRTALPVTNVAAVSAAGVATSATPPDPFVVRILNNPAFDPVHATFLPGTASAKIGTEAALPVSMQIDSTLDGAAWTVAGTYDASILDILGAVPLASGVTNSCTVADGAFTVRGTGGTLEAAADAQPLFALRVRPKVQYATRTTKVVFETVAATAADGRVFGTALGAGGDVTIRFSSETDAPDMSLESWAGEVIERETVSVPVRVTTTEALDREQFALEGTWDTARLELVRIEAADGHLASSPSNGAWRIEGTAGIVPAGTAAPGSLVFRAKDVAADAATLVHVTGGAAVSTEGLAGTVPATSWSILVRNNIAYDPAHAIFLPGSAATKVGTATTLPVSVQIDAPLDGAQWSIQGIFDTTLLDVTGATGADGLSATLSKSGGTFTVTGTGGTLAAASGSQALFTLTVTPKVQYATRLTSIAFSNPTAKTTDGRTFSTTVSGGGSIALRFADAEDPPIVAFSSEDRSVVERQRVSVPLRLATTDALDLQTLRLSVSWDAERLSFVEAQTGDIACTVSVAGNVATFQGGTGYLPDGEGLLANLVFDAIDVERDIATFLQVPSASARSAEGLAATIRQTAPFLVTILNNPAFDPVHATFLPGTASAKIGTDAALPVAVQIDAALDDASWTVAGTYDASILDILGAVALASGMTNSCTVADGAFTVHGTGGTLEAAADAQPLFALRVRPKVQYATRTTKVVFETAAATAADGRVFETTMGAGGDVAIRFSSETDAPDVSVESWAGEVIERETVSVPVRVATTEALDRGLFALEGTFDTARLELVRVEAADGYSASSPSNGAWRIEGTAGIVPAGTAAPGSLVFRAKDVTADAATLVHATGGTAVSTEGLAGTVPATSWSILVKNNIAYDPAHVVFLPGSAATKVGTATTLPISVQIDAPLDGAQWSIQGTFDTALLDVTGATGAGGMSVTFSKSSGTFTVRGTGGTLAAASGSQALFSLAVSAKTQYSTRLASITFRNATAKTTDGRTFSTTVSNGGDIALRFADSNEPPVVSFRSGALEVMERERVSVPIVFITTDTIDVSTIRISGTYPGQRLGFVRATAGDAGCSVTAGNGSWTLSGTTGFLLPNTATTLSTLVFDALDVTEDTITLVEVASASAKSAEGLDAVVRQASPIVVTIRNNPAFDPVHATFLPGTVSAKIGTEAALPVSVQIDAPLNGVAWMVSGTYDVSLIDILGATAVATGMSVECTATNGAFTVRGTGGTLAAKTAAQRMFSFTVRPVEQYATRQTTVAITNATATATDGRVFETAIGAGGAVGIHFSDTDTPPIISYPATSAEGYERREITVPLRLTTSQALDRGQLAIEGSWDAVRLELVRIEAAAGFSGSSPSNGAWRIAGTAGVIPAGTATLGALVFQAKDVTADTQTHVTVDGGTAVSTEGIAAPLVPSASFGVLVKNDPAFDPIHATFAIGSATAEIESVASVKVSATFEQPINGATLVAKIKYNTSLLTVTGVSPHVNGFTLSWSASGGILTVTGKGGTIPVPSSKLDLFTVSFRLAKQQTTHTANLSFAATPVAKSTDGRTYIIDSATGGSVAITWTEKPRYFKGDVDGDGDLDGDDVRMMAKIIQQGTKPTASELKAGDFNGDGKITTADYTLLKQYFKELGISNR